MLVLDLSASENKKNTLLMTVSMETVRVERSDLRLNLKATKIISLKNWKKKFASDETHDFSDNCTILTALLSSCQLRNTKMLWYHFRSSILSCFLNYQ